MRPFSVHIRTLTSTRYVTRRQKNGQFLPTSNRNFKHSAVYPGYDRSKQAEYTWHPFLVVTHIYFPPLDKRWSRVSSLLPPGSSRNFLSRTGFSNPTARRFFDECCKLTLSLSASQFVHKKKSPHELYESMHSGGFDLTKLSYTTLEDNLIRHRGDCSGLTCAAKHFGLAPLLLH